MEAKREEDKKRPAMRPCVPNAVAMVSGVLLEEAGKLNSQSSEGAGRVSSARPVFASASHVRSVTEGRPCSKDFHC